jgi:hypothetical protein
MDPAGDHNVHHRLLPVTLLGSPQPQRHRIGETPVQSSPTAANRGIVLGSYPNFLALIRIRL